MPREMTPWRCKNGHILGIVERNGSGVRVLKLFRYSILDDYPDWENEEMDIVATIEGYATDIICFSCNATRTWVPGEESLKRFIEVVKKNAI